MTLADWCFRPGGCRVGPGVDLMVDQCADVDGVVQPSCLQTVSDFHWSVVDRRCVEVAARWALQALRMLMNEERLLRLCGLVRVWIFVCLPNAWQTYGDCWRVVVLVCRVVSVQAL